VAALIAVVTAPKLRSKYLVPTLRQLDQQGAAGIDRVVLCDGPMTVECPWPVLCKPDGPSGTAPMMFWGFEALLRTDADRFLWCQDDLVVGRASVDRMLAVETPPDVALVTGFDQAEFKGKRIPAPGLYPVHPLGRKKTGLWGTLFLLLPRRTVEWIVSDRDPDWAKRTVPDDGILGRVIERSPWPWYLMRVPSDVDHAGDVSSGPPKRIRRATHFVGRR
jgi:hypothetical protein